jgi:adenine nucleotide transporter 17
VRKIVAQEGIAGLYSGLSSSLLGISFTNFVYYYWYEWTRAFFEAAAERAGRASKKLTTLETIIAGAIAGSATVIATNPIWVINTRMTTRRHSDGSSPDDGGEAGLPGPRGTAPRKAGPPTTLGTLLSLLRNEGPQALFAGLGPALVLVANPILQYTVFEQLKNALERRGRRVTPTTAFFLGALGKLFATSITYPYITVKSQMHVAGHGRDARKESMSQSLARVVREEGYAGLFKGESPCLFLSSPRGGCC